MDSGREEANWKIAKWILANLELCRTAEASKTKLDPDSWDIPERERKLQENEAKKRLSEQESDAAKNDPEKRAAYIAARKRQFQMFVSQFKGRRKS